MEFNSFDEIIGSMTPPPPPPPPPPPLLPPPRLRLIESNQVINQSRESIDWDARNAPLPPSLPPSRSPPQPGGLGGGWEGGGGNWITLMKTELLIRLKLNNPGISSPELEWIIS